MALVITTFDLSCTFWVKLFGFFEDRDDPHFGPVVVVSLLPNFPSLLLDIMRAVKLGTGNSVCHRITVSGRAEFANQNVRKRLDRGKQRLPPPAERMRKGPAHLSNDVWR